MLWFHNCISGTTYPRYETPIFIKVIQELYNKSHVTIKNELVKFLEKVITQLAGDSYTWDKYMAYNDWPAPLGDFQTQGI